MLAVYEFCALSNGAVSLLLFRPEPSSSLCASTEQKVICEFSSNDKETFETLHPRSESLEDFRLPLDMARSVSRESRSFSFRNGSNWYK